MSLFVWNDQFSLLVGEAPRRYAWFPANRGNPMEWGESSLRRILLCRMLGAVGGKPFLAQAQ